MLSLCWEGKTPEALEARQESSMFPALKSDLDGLKADKPLLFETITYTSGSLLALLS